MKKTLIFLVGLFSLLTVGNVRADQYGCNGQYGGYGSDCSSNESIIIDKTVGKMIENKGGKLTLEYVDNLSANDPRFKPQDYVYFQLKVRNTSDNELNNVTVRDTLPNYLTPVSGPGTFNKDNATILIENLHFNKNEEKSFVIKTQVSTQDKITEDKSIICLINKADVYNGTVSDNDTAQFCIEKQVGAITKVPSAGPEMGALLLGGQFGLLGLGLLLKKKLS